MPIGSTHAPQGGGVPVRSAGGPAPRPASPVAPGRASARFDVADLYRGPLWRRRYPDGRVLIVGGAGPSATASRFSLRRVLASGMRDGAFGTSGLTSTSFDLAAAEATGVAAQPDGALVVVGTASGPGASHAVVARYLASGVLDLGFGDHGSVFPGSGTHVEAADVLLDADGRCVVIGTSDGKPFLARLWL